MRFAIFGLAVAVVFAAACAQPLRAQDAGPPVVDARGHFRQVFCALLAADPAWSGDSCDKWLPRLSDEPPAVVAAASPASLQARFDLLIVPGIFGECASGIVTVFGDAVQRLAGKGFHAEFVPVRGRASSEHNARIVRDAVMRHAARAPGRRIVLVTYSKGTPDSLVALVAHPEIVRHVAALVSFAGVVKGSPLADDAAGLYGATIGKLPIATCPVIDSGEVESLTRTARLAWLSANRLPSSVRFYSLVAKPEPSRVSAVLLPPYLKLAAMDARNDSQVVYTDAVIPGGKLLGYVNADHWAIAIPFETQAPLLAATLVTANHFPRALLLEAALGIVEEDER